MADGWHRHRISLSSFWRTAPQAGFLIAAAAAEPGGLSFPALGPESFTMGIFPGPGALQSRDFLCSSISLRVLPAHNEKGILAFGGLSELAV